MLSLLSVPSPVFLQRLNRERRHYAFQIMEKIRMEIKCIYCNNEPCGMICTGNGYACPKCLLDRIDYLEKDVERLHENNRLIWCHLPLVEMLDLTARKVSSDLPPPINYIDRSEKACIELEKSLKNPSSIEDYVKEAIKILSLDEVDNG